MEIKRIGSYLKVDEQGYLIKQPNLVANAAHWLDAIDQVKNLYLIKWGDVIHSVYIRGSLAKGLAIDGVSDIDSFAVLKEDYSAHAATADYELFKVWAVQIEQDLNKTLPFVAGLELGLETLEGVLDRTNWFNLTIKTSAVCIYGDDLAKQIEAYKIDHHIAFQARYFEFHLERFLTEFPDESEGDKLTYIPWLMRRFLRLGMELVMETEQRYTRDLYLCFESFAKHYPEQKKEMYKALELAINPKLDDAMLKFAKTFGHWLVEEANRKLKTWGYVQNSTKIWEFNKG